MDGPDEMIADQANNEQAAQDIHRRAVEVISSHAGSELSFTDVVDDHRPDQAGRRPDRQKAPMNCFTNWVPNMSAKYAGKVENPPPYMDMMMPNARTNSALLPISANQGADA